MATNDPRKARLVWARSPSGDGQLIRLAVQSKTTRPLVETGRLDAMGEYMGLILLGEVLLTPTVIFQGIKRPYFGDGLDNFVFAYTCNPMVSYTYYLRDRFDGTGPHEIPPPREPSVFTTFVTLARNVVDDALQEIGRQDQEIRGVILGWEWTKASGSTNPRMPEAFLMRYRRTAWP